MGIVGVTDPVRSLRGRRCHSRPASLLVRAPRPGGSRSPSWTRLIIGLLIALVLASIMATTYITADHAVVAHNLPWGQVGSSPLTTTVQKSISLQVHQYASEADLEQAANEAKIYGGFIAQGNTLILSEGRVCGLRGS